MKEEFLHFVWKYGLYDRSSLLDSEGNLITVLNPGEYNRDSGPDFFNARIIYDGTLWAGNIEIHILSSHFNLHGHHTDRMYDNIILHLVHRNDRKVHNSKGEELLTVELSFDDKIHEKYLSLLSNPYIIACHDEVKYIDSALLSNWFDSLVVERLERKAVPILAILQNTGNDWEETFYRLLSRYFGLRVNTGPFEMLATALPFRILRKHSDNIFQTEALLFGMAGLLQEGLFKEAITDRYYKDLNKEFSILKSKYSLQSLNGWIWKFARLRPSNFPTIRISQLAAMLTATGGLFSMILELRDIDKLRQLFQVSASSYWDDHYLFGSTRKGNPKNTGSQLADIIIINAVIPLLYVYGKLRDRHDYSELALMFLGQMESENNSVIREWSKTGVVACSALASQALLQLREYYCRKRKCLECRVGFRLVSSGVRLKDQDQLLLEP